MGAKNSSVFVAQTSYYKHLNCVNIGPYDQGLSAASIIRSNNRCAT